MGKCTKILQEIFSTCANSEYQVSHREGGGGGGEPETRLGLLKY